MEWQLLKIRAIVEQIRIVKCIRWYRDRLLDPNVSAICRDCDVYEGMWW
jgi:hypothetical protein